MEGLHNRIAELEIGHQKSENLAGERFRQLEYEVQAKEQQVQILQDQIRDKTADFREKILKQEEELEIERENGIALERMTSQRDQF